MAESQLKPKKTKRKKHDDSEEEEDSEVSCVCRFVIFCVLQYTFEADYDKDQDNICWVSEDEDGDKDVGSATKKPTRVKGKVRNHTLVHRIHTHICPLSETHRRKEEAREEEAEETKGRCRCEAIREEEGALFSSAQFCFPLSRTHVCV